LIKLCIESRLKNSKEALKYATLVMTWTHDANLGYDVNNLMIPLIAI